MPSQELGMENFSWSNRVLWLFSSPSARTSSFNAVQLLRAPIWWSRRIPKVMALITINHTTNQLLGTRNWKRNQIVWPSHFSSFLTSHLWFHTLNDHITITPHISSYDYSLGFTSLWMHSERCCHHRIAILDIRRISSLRTDQTI